VLSAPVALLYCRPGFEKELAAELQAAAAGLGVSGFSKAKPDCGYVAFTPHDPAQVDVLARGLKLDLLVFARQLVAPARLVSDLPAADRASALVEGARALGRTFGEVILETADTDEGKALQVLCRKLAPPLAQAVRRAGLSGAEPGRPRLHAMLLGSGAGYVGLSEPGNSSAWPMGIPRLKFPPGAPSRSTLKLAEAILAFIPEDAERRRRLRAGMTGADLGASPGGWTYQLVERGIHVTAVDNGAMAQSLLSTGLVEHLREDGLRFRPRQPVDWLLCDMVEKPSRIAALVGEWMAQGLAREAIFNLKLPMKRRLEEVQSCRRTLSGALGGAPHELRLKQLYHDRQEVTGHLRRL
jgi:23S rRNA (cytidine2498-2'-O)-methyltransferase